MVFPKVIKFLPIILLIALSLLHLHFALATNLYFKVDDFSALSYYQNHTLLRMIPEFLIHGDFFGFRRLVGHINFKLMFDAFGTNHLAYILQNHIFHTVNLILFFFLTKHISKNSLMAFLAAIVYNKFYLFYFSNSHEYLLGFFCLTSIYIVLKHSKYAALSVALFALALLTKEVAFTLPFFLAALPRKVKPKSAKLKPYFVVLGAYIFYQGLFVLTGQLVPGNESYFANTNLASIIERLFYFVPPVLLLLPLLAIWCKQRYLLLIFGVFILSLAPNLILVNKTESYYLYIPLIFLLTGAVVLAAKSKFTLLATSIILFVGFGGRQIFPVLARQTYPNWDKIAIEAIVATTEENLADSPQNTIVNLSEVSLERDGRLMLENQTLNLFVKPELRKRYNFEYLHQEVSVKVSMKDLSK